MRKTILLVTLRTATSAPEKERASNVTDTQDTPSTIVYHHQDAIVFAIQSEGVFSVIAESADNA